MAHATVPDAKSLQEMPPSKPELCEFWERVIDPDGIGMPESIAREIGEFTSEPVSVVLQKMETGAEDLTKLWVDSQVDPHDPERVTTFYRDQFVEAYELANWHCGRTFGEPPIKQYPFAALFAQRMNLRRALDFGSGIGSGSLALASVGCEVHSADIARQLLQFVEFRMRRRRLTPHIIDLNTDQRPRSSYYDLITCFDVLEHVPDQFVKLRELESYLRPGGYLIVNFYNDCHDEDRPMHISSSGSWIRMVRQTSLCPMWHYFRGAPQVVMKKPLGRVWNWLAAMQDRWQGVK